MTLLAQRDDARAAERAALFHATRSRLREALRELAPGCEFWVFGSLVHPGRFNATSDVDLAFTTLPAGKTEFLLLAELEERLSRRVDVVDLYHSRLRSKIEREGERWIA
jgi:predicted nucleotidyltransferase